MERIEGYVDHIIYRNQDNGYTVMNVIADGEEITCVGPASLYWRRRAGGDHRPLQGSCHLRPPASDRDFGNQGPRGRALHRAVPGFWGGERHRRLPWQPGSCGSSMRTPSGLWRRSRSGWPRSRASVRKRPGRLRLRWKRRRICEKP